MMDAVMSQLVVIRAHVIMYAQKNKLDWTRMTFIIFVDLSSLADMDAIEGTGC